MDLIDREALDKTIWSKCEEIDGLMLSIINNAPTVDAEPVRHGKWLLEAHKENANFRWNVTAKCSECDYDLGEIWEGFFPCIPDGIAEDVCFNSAKSVDVSNYCPHCGAKMGD